MQNPDAKLPKGPARLTPVEASTEQVLIADPPESEGLPLGEYWRIVKRYAWSILVVAAMAGIIGLLNAVSATSLYRAHARLLVKFNQPNISSLQQFEPTPLHWLFYETQADIIRSRAIAERVVERLGIAEQAADGAEEASPERDIDSVGLRARIGAFIEEAKTWLPQELRPPEHRPLDAEARRLAVVNSVLGGVQVSGGKESEVLVVSYVSPDPERAATVANAFAEAYIDFSLESRASNVQQTTTWLGQRIEELRQKVMESEQALREYQAQEDLIDTQNREKIISAKLGTLTAELIKAQSRRSEAEARYKQVKSFLDGGTDYETIASAMNSTIVLDAHRDKAALERRVSELSKRYGDKHPKMIAAKADLDEAIRRLKAEVNKGVSSIRKEYELAASQEREFRNIIASQQAEMRKLSGKAFAVSQLEREVEANRRLYDTFLARFKEADIAGEYDVSNVRIIDKASAPTTPFMPNRKRMVLISIVIGLGIGVLIAFLRDHFDNSFKTKEDVEEKLKLPVIGMLPRIKPRRKANGSAERHLLGNPRSGFAEAIHDIRTAILFSHIDHPPKVILITSAIPGEGKTTLASNLALAFSKRGRTLLVDADLRKGRLQEVTKLEGRPGLTDLLSGACTATEAIVPDKDAENLFLLTAGTLPPNPLEVISSQRFAENLNEIRDSFEYVVIDGTPLLPVSDSIVLARLVDSVVLSIKADATTRHAALEALKRVRSARLRPVGVVLQQLDMRKVHGYGKRYGKSYGGYYGYYGARAN